MFHSYYCYTKKVQTFNLDGHDKRAVLFIPYSFQFFDHFQTIHNLSTLFTTDDFHQLIISNVINIILITGMEFVITTAQFGNYI